VFVREGGKERGGGGQNGIKNPMFARFVGMVTLERAQTKKNVDFIGCFMG
jgi:hypothetical protein